MVKEKRKPSKEKFKEKVKNIPSPLPGEEQTPGRIRRTDEEIRKDEEAKIRKILTDKPDPVLVPFVKIIFNLWPNSVLPTIPYKDILEQAEKTLLITDNEAISVAIPLTQLKNYYLPQMNPVWFAWANLASAVFSITSIRIQILKEFRHIIAERKGQQKPSQFCICANSDKIPLDGNNRCTVCHKGRPPQR